MDRAGLAAKYWKLIWRIISVMMEELTFYHAYRLCGHKDIILRFVFAIDFSQNYTELQSYKLIHTVLRCLVVINGFLPLVLMNFWNG